MDRTAKCQSTFIIIYGVCGLQVSKIIELECGPMSNAMAALPNIGGPSVQRRKVWLTPTTMPCSNAAKTRNPLKLARVPQTNETISAASRPKFTMLPGHAEEILLFNKFFSDCRYMP